MKVDTVYEGDCLEQLCNIDNDSIQCVITSPPYWGLRDYFTPGQFGLEPTPEQYVDNMVNVFTEIKRVLKKDGTIWLNLGDSYYGSAGKRNPKSRGKYTKDTKGTYDSISSASNKVDRTAKHPYLKPKDLAGIPWRVAFALQERLRFYLRQAIIWHKPNAMPENVTDRPTTDYEFIFLLSKSKNYYYNHKAVLEKYVKPMDRGGGEELKANGTSAWDERVGQNTYRQRNMRPNPEGRNCRAVWSINTKPYHGAHFAVFPEEIPERCIKAGTKKGDIVLDPFAGSGTTLWVAKKLNRRYIGIELSKEYISLIKDRLRQDVINFT